MARLLVAASVLSALLAAAPFALVKAGSTVTLVSQKGRVFAPSHISVAKGGTVRFTNDDPFLHQTYASSPTFSFDSDELSPGQTADVVFPIAGDFKVLCAIHPKMSLTVHVR